MLSMTFSDHFFGKKMYFIFFKMQQTVFRIIFFEIQSRYSKLGLGHVAHDNF